METGFKLLENENGYYVTYVLSGGVSCKSNQVTDVADAVDKIGKVILDQMVKFLNTCPKTLNTLKENENEGTEI